MSIALFFSSFVLSTSLDSLERTKLNEITEGPKKKNPFQCLALMASLLVNNFCYILQTGRLFPTRGFAGGFVYNPEEQQFAIKKKKIEQQQKKSSKNKTKQTKQKQREDVYVRQTKTNKLDLHKKRCFYLRWLEVSLSARNISCEHV